jgi:hypothetical protein
MVNTKYSSMRGPGVRFPASAKKIHVRESYFCPIGVRLGRGLMGARPVKVGAYPIICRLLYLPCYFLRQTRQLKRTRFFLHRLRLSASNSVEE